MSIKREHPSQSSEYARGRSKRVADSSTGRVDRHSEKRLHQEAGICGYLTAAEDR